MKLKYYTFILALIPITLLTSKCSIQKARQRTVFNTVHDQIFEQLCSKAKSNIDLEACYIDYVNRNSIAVEKVLSNNPKYFDLPELDKSARQFIFEMDESSFDSIWTAYKTVYDGKYNSWVKCDRSEAERIEVDSTSEFYGVMKDMTTDSKLRQLLLPKSKHAPYIFIKNNNDGFNGDWKVFIQVMNYPEYFDAKDYKIRLLIAINLLTFQFNNEKP